MMRQSENHHWRRLAQLAQDPEALCGACASAPVPFRGRRTTGAAKASSPRKAGAPKS